MTTTTERLDRATFQRRWSDDLAAAHTEARDKWAKAAAESAGELRAFADFLHELDVPGLVAMADDLATERLSETAEWPAWAELDDESEPYGLVVIDVPVTAEQAQAIRRRFEKSGSGRVAIKAREIIQPTSVIPAEPDPEMGRQIRAALTDKAHRAGWTPDPLVRRVNEGLRRIAPAAAEFPGVLPATPLDPVTEYQQRPEVDDEPLLRRVGEALKEALLRVDRWAERIGEDKP